MDQIEEMELRECMEQAAEEKYFKKLQRPTSFHSTPSVRSNRSLAFKRHHIPPKPRHNICTDKLQWNGLRSSYPSFAQDLEGNMIRVGAGYLFEKAVMDGYAVQGMEYIESDLFWNEHAIGTKQFKYDIKFLYGILQSATKTRLNPYLIHHRNDNDGLAVWIKFDKTYANGGSKNMRSEELEEQIYLRYNPREHKGIAEYIDKFQTWMEELDALGT